MNCKPPVFRPRHPPIRRFDEDGHPTPEYLAEQASLPHASAIVTKVSGISDEAAPGAIGKLLGSFMLGTFRPRDDRRLSRLTGILNLPAHARIYKETNGKGHAFYRARCRLRDLRTGISRPRSVYLGSDPGVVQWARDILVERLWDKQKDEPPEPDLSRLESLRTFSNMAKSTAKTIAARAGFGFHGMRLVRRKQ